MGVNVSKETRYSAIYTATYTATYAATQLR